MDNITFGLNRIMAPKQDLETFFKFTSEMGIKYLEVRNDLPGQKIFDDYTPTQVREMSEKYGVTVYTVNALQQFNRSEDLEAKLSELTGMVELAAAGGCKAVILCPLNDSGDKRSDEEQLHDTIKALDLYGSVFESNNMIGLVEPLGFSICSIRTKKKAVEAIEASKYSSRYKLVHDTFHHYLAGEEKLYPEHTGLVHISGVEDRIEKTEINDDNRVLIGEMDIMSNLGQIKDLLVGGYEDIFSFEPFGPTVQNMDSVVLKAELKKSMDYITAAL